MSPFFRVLDEPLGPSEFFGPVGRSQQSTSPFYGHPFARSLFNDPLLQQLQQQQQRPSIHLTEDDSQYVVEADLPGVKKENVDVRIGDGGRSITIEGKVFHRRTGLGVTGEENRSQSAPPETNAGQQQQAAEGSSSNEKAVSQTPPAGEFQNQQQPQQSISTSSSRFTRSIWLPRPVDGSTVKAKLEHGILTLTIPKPHDKESVKVNVE